MENSEDGTGYVAVDDIQYNNCGDSGSISCEANEFTCSNGQCAMMDEVNFICL